MNHHTQSCTPLFPLADPPCDMTELVLSEAERILIQHGVEEGLRCDGRGRGDVRPVVLETGVVSHARY